MIPTPHPPSLTSATSNALHGFNFDHRKVKFSDIVSNTIMVMNLNFKRSKIYKQIKNLQKKMTQVKGNGIFYGAWYDF